MPTNKINNGDFQGDQTADSIFESFNKVNENNTLIDNLEIEIENVRGEIPTATLPEANITAGVVEGDLVNAPSNDGVFKELKPINQSKNIAVTKGAELLTVSGSFVLKTGVVNANSNFVRTDKIRCSHLRNVRVSFQQGSSAGMAFYTREGVSVGGFNGNDFTGVNGTIIWEDVDVPLLADYFLSSFPVARVSEYRLGFFGYSDASSENKYEISTLQTNTFVGSFNFAVKALYDAKPDAKIIVISNFTHDLAASISGVTFNKNGSPVITMQKIVSDFWGCQFVNLADNLNVFKNIHADTLSELVPDRTHPGGDKENGWILVNQIARYISQEIGHTFDDWTGKRIAWYGTSIPAGFPNLGDFGSQYPRRVASLLGANISNFAVSSSLMRLTKENLQPVDSSRPSFLDTNNSVNYIDSMVNLIGTPNEPDVFIFDHGRNDFVDDQTDFDIKKWNV